MRGEDISLTNGDLLHIQRCQFFPTANRPARSDLPLSAMGGYCLPDASRRAPECPRSPTRLRFECPAAVHTTLGPVVRGYAYCLSF